MTEPNSKQQELIENTDGCYVVDAGPGTGKTFTITRRYAEIIAQDDVEPEDVLLLTFTRNAATEMRDRIITQCEYGARELQDAPIQTFHALCNDILRERGFDAPSHLGLDEPVTGSTQLIEDETIEHRSFREFISCFTDDHPEHHDLLRVVSEPTDVLTIIKNLASKGVFPTTDGWYRDCEDILYGDEDAFTAIFDELNQPRNGGSRQSTLKGDLNSYGGDACYLPDAPSKSDIRGGAKAVPDHVGTEAFDEERTDLVSFVHDVYIEYLEFALSRNYLNFAFLQLLAFVHCCETDTLRDQLAYEYVMIDEFQDTSEIQFKLALLLSETTNLCVVGDWKQSIYSFQYADVENITDFPSRLRRFVDDLNADQSRLDPAFEPIHSIELDQNYRSTQSLIKQSEEALTVPGSSSEDVDVEAVLENVVSLEANTDYDHSCIEAFHHEDEHEAILTKIDEIVGNDAYAVRDDDAGGLRPPAYDDIAVLTRTRDFGRELLAAAEEHDYPLTYEGGVELFRTDPAKMLLAWLRILQERSDRGWAVVLEQAGYRIDEIQDIIETETYPTNMAAFRKELTSLETVGAVARRVFERYGYDGPTADVIRSTIQSVHNSTTLTRGDLIQFIEDNIEAGTTHDVYTATGTNAVHVKTIHSTKGLEYPIVLMANMNRHRFPPNGGTDGQLVFDERLGLRQRSLYGEEHGRPHIYDNWHWDVLKHCRPQDHDEERRLLYVAMTRARDHVLFSAGDEPNTFLEELPIPIESYEPALNDHSSSQAVQSRFDITIPDREGPANYSPHSLMDDSVFKEVEEGRGIDFGSRVHEFAERYALREDVEPDGTEQERIQALIDSMNGELKIEESAYLPLDVDGEEIILHGIVDLVHVTDATVEIIDYKTDRSRLAESEYQIQLSVYYHVLADAYPTREVSASLFYTADDERCPITPLSKDDLRKLVRDQLSDG